MRGVRENYVESDKAGRNTSVLIFLQLAGYQREKTFGKDACFIRYFVYGAVFFI